MRPAQSLAAAALLLLRLLLRLQPRRFRETFGREAIDDYTHDLQQASGDGTRAVFVAASRAIGDSCVGVVLGHARQFRSPRKGPPMFTRLTLGLSHDVRYALRSLARQPRYTLTALFVLALAIGTATAMFGVVNAVLLRPLPYHDPSRLVAVTSRLESAAGLRRSPFVTLTDVRAWRPHTTTLEALGAFTYTQLPVRAAQHSHFAVTALVDAALLPMLGIPAGIGTFFDERAEATRERTAIISHAFWREAFGGDPGVLGRTLLVDGDAYAVRGVLAADFQFPRPDAAYNTRPVELVILSSTFPNFPAGALQWFGIARIRPSISRTEAEAELQAIARASGPETASERWTVEVTPLDAETRRNARRPVLIVFAISLVLLLVAATNLTNLLVARGLDRLRELSIRAALGSTAARLVRLLLTESLLLSLAGGVIGIFLARLTIRTVAALSPVRLPVSGAIGIDGSVVWFALGLCALTALVAGALPALHLAGRSSGAIRDSGTRVSGSRTAIRLQRAICVAQIALGVTLVTAAGLLGHSLLRLHAVDLGFDADRIVGFDLSVPGDVPLERREAFYADALAEVRTVPGVESVGLITFLPPEVRSGVFMNVAREGETPSDASRSPRVNTLVASADTFSTLGMTVLRGRAFSSADDARHEAVAVVNETFARQFFPTDVALGRRIGTGFDGLEPVRRIVGIVSDARDRGPSRAPTPTVYLPFTQRTLPYTSIAVRVQADPEGVTSVIRERLTRLNPDVPLSDFQTVSSRLAEAVREPRFYTLLACVCAGMAVLFVSLGLYGLVSYSVSHRRSELGIRLALGAGRGEIRRLVLGEGLTLAAAGSVLGLLLSLLTSRLLSTLLFEVEPTDLRTLASAVVLLLGVTLLASYGPARRAQSTDPLEVLRNV